MTESDWLSAQLPDQLPNPLSGQARTGITIVTLAALVLVVAAAAPSLVGARPANQIPVPTVDEDLSSPDAEGWSDVPAVEVPLSSAPSGVPDAGTTTVRTLHIRAAQTSEQLYLRLEWPDATMDAKASSPRTFADAAAVQLPVNTSVRPAIAMGSTRNLVNVWYWSPPSGTQELLAGGPGTTTTFTEPAVDVTTARLESSPVAEDSVGDDGADGEDRWSVVYARALQPGGTNRTAIAGGNDVDVAFGVWNGSAMERSGRKAVSDWYHMPFGPGQEGPPFASILWAVAGIAVVAVVAVTLYGIRHARQSGSGNGSTGGGGGGS
ncbi:MAG: ethylbenzene dehydrogenase-related protein [Haloarculaceae archaeon]